MYFKSSLYVLNCTIFLLNRHDLWKKMLNFIMCWQELLTQNFKGARTFCQVTKLKYLLMIIHGTY